MYRNVNLDAHVSALLFLGSVAVLGMLLLAIVVLLFWRRAWLKYVISALAVWVVGYGCLLLGFSLFSRERTLARGEEKYFCELDCHLAYSVQGVERVKAIGDATAKGEFYVVTLRAGFDSSSIAPWRPRDVPVTPDPLDFAVTNEQGDAIGPSVSGQKAWEETHGVSRSLREPLRPGESYETTLVFDVPRDVQAPRLLAWFGVFPTQLLIGDESSVLHKKTFFRL